MVRCSELVEQYVSAGRKNNPENKITGSVFVRLICAESLLVLRLLRVDICFE